MTREQTPKPLSQVLPAHHAPRIRLGCGDAVPKRLKALCLMLKGGKPGGDVGVAVGCIGSVSVNRVEVCLTGLLKLAGHDINMLRTLIRSRASKWHSILLSDYLNFR